MVARDHGHTNAALAAFFHSRHGLLAWGVDDAGESEKDEVAGEAGGIECILLDLRLRQPRQGEHTLSLRGDPLVLLLPKRQVEGCGVAPGFRLPVAIPEDHVRSPLYEEERPVQSRHEFVLRLERDHVRARMRRQFRGAIDSGFCRERQERSLGRIAREFPRPVLLVDVRLVAERRGARHQRDHPGIAGRAPVKQNAALGGVAGACDLVKVLRRGQGCDDHFIARERSGLVRADARHRAEGLDRWQPADDGVAPGHALHAECKGDRDHRGQSLGDRGHGDADRGLEHIHKSLVEKQCPVGEHECADDEDDNREHLAELLDLPEKRRLHGFHARKHPVDVTQLGPGSRGDNHALATPGDDERAGVSHTFAVADLRTGAGGFGRLVHRNRLAGEWRLLDPQILYLAQAEVGRDFVARLQDHNVAGHEVFGGNHPALAVTQCQGLRGEHVADRIQRLLRLALLQKPEQPVDQHHAEDHAGVEKFTEENLANPRRDQHVDQHVVQLHEESHQRSAFRRSRQPVLSVFCQA